MGKRPATTLGSIIRRQRELADLSMHQVAESVGISNPYLSQIERGLRAPSDAVLRAIAGRLDTNMDYLYAMAGYIEPANDEPSNDEATESGLLRAIKDAPRVSKLAANLANDWSISTTGVRQCLSPPPKSPQKPRSSPALAAASAWL